jgi:hypothetical protein
MEKKVVTPHAVSKSQGLSPGGVDHASEVARRVVTDQSASRGDYDLILEFRSVDMLGYRNRPCVRLRRPYPGMRRP